MSEHFDAGSQLASFVSVNAISSRFNILQNWAKEIKQYVENPKDDVIKLLMGKAVMVECEDLEDFLGSLPSIASLAGMQFLKLSPLEASSFLQGESSVMKDLIPSLVYIPIECFSEGDGRDGVSKKDGVIVPTWLGLSNFLDSSNSISPLIIVTCGESFGEITKELRAASCFDKYFTIRGSTPIERAQCFIDAIGEECLDETISQSFERVGTLLNSGFPGERRMGLLVMAMKRLAYKTQRILTYRDLLDFTARGTGQMAERQLEITEYLFRIAVHEAGHALVAMVDSDWKNIPDYVSIKSGRGFEGIMIDSYAFLSQQKNTSGYLNTRHSIRVSLAGRAAEEVLLGAEGIGLEGVSADLESISGLVRKHIARYGMSPEMEVLGSSGDNLAVVIGAESGSESAHVETLARQFVKRQYEQTLEIVRSHRKLLEEVVQKLQSDRTMYQEDLSPMVQSYRISLNDANFEKTGCSQKLPSHI
ncbi:MAG: hypothetical protein V4536_02745 [Pseudomonadota bacterium]